MKLTFSLLFACVTVVLQAQVSFPDSIGSSKTSLHQALNGTGVLVIIPAGFSYIETPMPGYATEKASGFMAMQFPADINVVLEGYTKEAFAKQGIELLSKKTVSVHGMKGYYFEGKQKSQGYEFQKGLLLFGTSNRSYQVVTSYCKELEDKAGVLQQVLQSIYIEKSVVQEKERSPRMLYSIDLGSSQLKYASSMNNGLANFYTSDGKYPPEDKDQFALIVEQLPEKVIVAEQDNFATEKNKEPIGSAYNSYKLASKKKITINGISGLELISFDYYTDSGKKSRGFYQVFLFTNDMTFVLSGYCRRDIDIRMEAFKTVVKSFRLK